jgi:indolepyruvate ferredoxin oxidoreductase beta subunit
MAAVGLAADYDVKKSDILGLAIRGGAVISHVRWGERVHSPIVPEGRADYLVAFEILEGLRWLDQVSPKSTILLNQQEIHPVTVSSGFATYPDQDTIERALAASESRVYRVTGLDIAQELGNARVLNVVLLGALSGLLTVDAKVWETILIERVPERFRDLNLKAFQQGREWIQERNQA